MTETPTGAVTVACRQYGDSAVLADVESDDYELRWSVTQAIGQALRTTPPPGFVDIVASYQTAFVSFDPLVTDHQEITAAIERVVDHPPPRPDPRRFTVPVAYGGAAGPDLESTAALLDLTPSEVVELHTSHDWVVRFVGSPLGAPMMDGPRMPLSVPRLAEPRARLEPGSVGLSGFQSIIYNAASPGGWRLIGRTPALLFDLGHPPHVAYRPGDRIRFRALQHSNWDRWRRPLDEPSIVTSEASI